MKLFAAEARSARDELVRMCLKPGVSIARTAMEHDVNPNQLRKWITRMPIRKSTGSR
ncbi:transposase [Paraburkholderia youngii]|uniref:transposase n=1 Tax=Paraburkholderia youngii TaxID=2782701 RepID=UPI003D243FD9